MCQPLLSAASSNTDVKTNHHNVKISLMLKLKQNFSVVLIYKIHPISFLYNKIDVCNKDVISICLKNNRKRNIESNKNL